MPTQKDFQRTAAIIATLPDRIRGQVARHFAKVYARQNPRFKLHLFFRACGVGK